MDISREFRHLKVDPLDLDLLGLKLDSHYFNTSVPFGTRPGSQFSQHASDVVYYIMCQHGHDVINNISDFLGFGTPTIGQASLLHVMYQLGLTISDKKLNTQGVCLGVLIDTIQGTVSI